MLLLTNTCLLLLLVCSDGTYIGALGYWGKGDQQFSEYTETEGYTAIQARINVRKSVAAVSFKAAWQDFGPWYGSPGAPLTGNSTCRGGERIVGLSCSSLDADGIGAVGALCGFIECESAVGHP